MSALVAVAAFLALESALWRWWPDTTLDALTTWDATAHSGGGVSADRP